MRITKHAETRILKGDKHGLRTNLSAKEVMAKIASPYSIKMGRETFFWSEPDDCCLMAITAKQGTVLVTVYPAERDMAPWMGLLSKYRTLGKTIFREFATNTYDPYQAVQIRMVDYDSKKGIDGIKGLGEPFCVWFGFDKCDSSMFWTKDFIEMLADCVSQHLERNKVSENKKKKLRVEIHGNYWAFLIPIHVPFEILGLPDPFD